MELHEVDLSERGRVVEGVIAIGEVNYCKVWQMDMLLLRHAGLLCITLALYIVLYYWFSLIYYFGVFLGYILSSNYTREPELGSYRRKCRRLTMATRMGFISG